MGKIKEIKSPKSVGKYHRNKTIVAGSEAHTTEVAPTMIYIYARVSTEGQTTDNQVVELLAKYPGAKVVLETASGVKARPHLMTLVDGLRPGEIVYCYSLDRLGRSTKQIIQIIEAILAKGAKLELKREGVSYDSAIGKLVLQVMAAVAEMERNLISERTKTALQARKAAGVKLGAPKHHPDAKRLRALAMLEAGKSIRIVAKLLNVSKSTVQAWSVSN